MNTIKDLLTTIERLPAADRREAVATVERILELEPASRMLALGLLALDLAPLAPQAPGSDAAAEDLVA